MRISNTIGPLLLSIMAGCSSRLDSELPASNGTNLPMFQVGLVLDSPTPGSIPMVFTHKSKEGTQTNEMLNVRKIQGLDEKALETTVVWQRGEVVCIDAVFDQKARGQLADLTRTNVGNYAVTIIDGKVCWAGKIGGEVSDGKIGIFGDWTLKNAQAIQERLDKARTGR